MWVLLFYGAKLQGASDSTSASRTNSNSTSTSFKLERLQTVVSCTTLPLIPFDGFPIAGSKRGEVRNEKREESVEREDPKSKTKKKQKQKPKAREQQTNNCFYYVIYIMTLSRSSSCGTTAAAAALLFLSTTASITSGFLAINQNNPTTFTTLPLHATNTNENFQRSLLAAQIANNDVKKLSSSPTKSLSLTSVDYDAAARLAFQKQSSSSSSEDFETFKVKYLEDTSNLMATKQRTRVAKEKAAAAKEKAQKAAEAAQLAKEKAQRKIQEQISSSSASTVAEPESADEKVVAAAPSKVESSSATTASSSSTKQTQFTVPRELALVPINESTVQFTAGALGATAGLLLGGGPFLAIFLSATANYLSRKDDNIQSSGKDGNIATATSPKRIVDTASQTVLLIYNFLAQFERDNKIVDGTFKVFEGAVDKAKQNEESGEAIVALESTLGGLVTSIGQLNEDYDLVGGAGTILNSVGDLVETGVDKVVELNEEYKLSDRVGGIVKGAVDKAFDKKE